MWRKAFSTHRALIWTLLGCPLLAACPAAGGSGDIDRAGDAGRLEWADVLPLERARDYFALRDRLAAAPDTAALPVRFARALVQHAFNEPAASNATIDALLVQSLPDSLAARLRQLEVSNDLRLSTYAAGLTAVDALLAHPAGVDTGAIRDLRNTQRLFRTLATTPPQTVSALGPTVLHLEHGRVPVTVNDSARTYVFDTGANLSTLMRSEAIALGLRIRPAGLDVGTSTGRPVTADLAVADDLAIGSLRYHHVVFLVLDDSLLTFPGGFRIPGIVGFPVIEQMGEVRFGRDGVLAIPDPVPHRAERNLALDELTPLVRVTWSGAPLVCRLDTGANASQLYEPFYVRFRPRIDSASRPAVRRYGGAGGVRATPVRVLRSVRLSLGDTVAVLDSLDVLVQSIVSAQDVDYLDCNIGHDVLDRFASYVLNFRDMAFVLR